MLRAVIIDDEEKSRKLLRNLLQTYCKNVEVAALADSVSDGIKAVRQQRPDIVFLDIVMPRENGFELLNQIEGIDFEVIFTTAYDQYAIRAIKACALDYLLKPIDVEELQMAMARAEEKLHDKQSPAVDQRLAEFITNLQAPESPPRKIGIPTLNGVKFCDIDRIMLCKAEGNYTTIYIEGNQKLELVARTLKEFEELLSEHNFLRTHRSFLVNLSHLKEYLRGSSTNSPDGEGGCVVLSNNLKAPVSRDKRKILLERISRPF